MSKIGILTFWNIPNYGTFLQAFAMQKVLSDLYPNDEVRLIGYIDKLHFNKYYKIIDSDFKYALINPRFYKHNLKRFAGRKNIKKLKSFMSYYCQIPNTGNLKKSTLEQMHFDTVVLGSDIIWDYSIPFFNHDPYLFGNHLNCDNIISYAASFGTVKLSDDVPEYVKTGIKGLNTISVRDENSSSIVKKIIGIKPDIVIDPTFLMDFKQVNEIINPEEDNYIIVYGSHISNETAASARKYANLHDMKIICLNSLDDNYSWCDKCINQNELTPFEWLGYFKCASIVMTCTFHGLMFGLNFEKKVVFNPTQFILDKAESFINDLELRDVLIEMKTFDEKVNYKWNYNEINKKIDVFRSHSIDYIKKAVKNG